MKLLTATGPDFPNDFAPNQKAERRCNDAEEDQVEVGSWLPEA